MSTPQTKTKPDTKTDEAKLKKLHMPKWNSLYLVIQFREQGISGNQPVNDMAGRYAKLVSSGTSNEIKLQLQEEGIVDGKTIETYLKNCTALLPVDENGFYIRENQIIGMLCMAGARTKWTTERKGMKATLIQGTTKVIPYKIYLKGGELDSVTRGMSTMRGSTIKSSQILTGTEPAEFEVSWLDNRDITVDDMKSLLTLGQEIGLGGDRRFGYGRFDILSMTKTGKPNNCKSS